MSNVCIAVGANVPTNFNYKYFHIYNSVKKSSDSKNIGVEFFTTLISWIKYYFKML